MHIILRSSLIIIMLMLDTNASLCEFITLFIYMHIIQNNCNLQKKDYVNLH